MPAFKTIILLTSFFISYAVQAQKPLIASFEYKYTRTKYNESKSAAHLQNSFSYQFIGGIAKEVKDGLRLGVKAGLTIDKIYSDLGTRQPPLLSAHNILAFVGISAQKRLLTDRKSIAALWLTTDISAEPFISRKSIFKLSYPSYDSFPENAMINYNGAYIDKRVRLSITPALRAEFNIFKNWCFFGQFGYAIELGRSNLVEGYFTNLFTLENFPQALPPSKRIKENYLFAGGGINYYFKKH